MWTSFARWRFGVKAIYSEKVHSISGQLFITTISVFRVITKLFSIFGHFSFSLDFPTGAVSWEFDSLEVNFNSSETQRTHPHSKPRLLIHQTSKSLANRGL